MNEAITQKLEAQVNSTKAVIETYRSTLATDIAAGCSTKRIMEHVTLLAETDGCLELWDHLATVCERLTERGEEFTPAVAMQRCFMMVARGADDRWSGRSNDANRSHFDGLRTAAQNVEYIF